MSSWRVGGGSGRAARSPRLTRTPSSGSGVACCAKRARYKLNLVWPILVTILVGGADHLARASHGASPRLLLAVETWIFIVVMWAGCLWIARGTWRPLADTTAAFVDISIRRREANLRGATFGACLYVVQLVFIVLALGAASPAGFVPRADVDHT